MPQIDTVTDREGVAQWVASCNLPDLVDYIMQLHEDVELYAGTLKVVRDSASASLFARGVED